MSCNEVVVVEKRCTDGAGGKGVHGVDVRFGDFEGGEVFLSSCKHVSVFLFDGR